MPFHNYHKSLNLQHVTTCKKQLATDLYHNCNKSCKLQGNGRRHVPCLSIMGVFSRQAADAIDWTVRCDWLQPASCKFQLPA